ncbi:MAG: hypothetical protein M3114_05885 [Thermoproteota archaeon]|nr:hypothetical protein [Thermoproteota archaeon]
MGNAELSVKVTEALFAIMRAWRFKFIYRVGIPAASIFLIFSLSYAINNFGNLFAEAQGSVTTVQDEQNTNEAIQTFNIDGAIGGLITDLLNSTMRENVTGSLPPIYVLVGNWSMGVVNGEVNYFQADFIMGLENGTQMQVYSVENLENIVISPPPPSSPSEEAGSTPSQELSSNNNLVLSSTNNYSLSLFGYVDVSTDGTVQWRNVPVSMNIFNGNTISILLYPSETDNRFKGQPIYGVVTDILDANNNPIKPSIWSAAT